MPKKIYIEGMSCDNCAKHVQKALIQVDGVKDVMVSLEGKYADVELAYDVDDKLLKEAVEDAGYDVVKIE